MLYRLWDTDNGHMYGAFNNEDEALALVRTLASSYGETIATDLTLTYERPDGTNEPARSGAELIRHAREVAAARI